MDLLDRSYAKKLASGIRSITVNSTNDGLYFETNGGTSFDVKLPNFHSHLNKTELDKFSYDSTNNQLLYDGQPISGNIKSYEEEITTASSTWSIQHNLGAPYWKLTINIIDADGNSTEGNTDKSLSTDNLLVLKFTEPISGKIYIKK